MIPEWRIPPLKPVLLEREVHVWYADFARAGDSGQAAKCLSSEERARAGRFTSEQAGRAYILSHGFLRNVLARYLKQTPSTIPFDSDVRGKPHLKKQGDEPPLQFNLSRCHSGTICAVAVGTSVGVDLESLNPALCADSTAEQVFTPLELRQLSSLEGDRRILAFFQCWTRKEAYAKCTGTGLSSELKSITVGLEDTSITLGQSFLATFPCPGGEIASIAFAATPVEVRFWHIAS